MISHTTHRAGDLAVAGSTVGVVSLPLTTKTRIGGTTYQTNNTPGKGQGIHYTEEPRYNDSICPPRFCC